jgi:predicted GIY-YIG superfamily endonuclease
LAGHNGQTKGNGMIDEIGDIYLLHFDRPLAHALHYTGWARNLAARLAKHAKGTSGAKIMDALFAAGIGFTVASVHKGTRTDERRLKNHGATRRCPICQTAKQIQTQGAIAT